MVGNIYLYIDTEFGFYGYFFNCLVGCKSMIVWTPADFYIYACVLYFCINCTCSVQLSMFHMERSSRNKLCSLLLMLLLLCTVQTQDIQFNTNKMRTLHRYCTYGQTQAIQFNTNYNMCTLHKYCTCIWSNTRYPVQHTYYLYYTVQTRSIVHNNNNKNKTCYTVYSSNTFFSVTQTTHAIPTVYSSNPRYPVSHKQHMLLSTVQSTQHSNTDTVYSSNTSYPVQETHVNHQIKNHFNTRNTYQPPDKDFNTRKLKTHVNHRKYLSQHKKHMSTTRYRCQHKKHVSTTSKD